MNNHLLIVICFVVNLLLSQSIFPQTDYTRTDKNLQFGDESDAIKINDVTPASWQWQNPIPQGNDLCHVTMVGDNIAYIYGVRGTFLKTIDYGKTWYVQHYTSGSVNLGTGGTFYGTTTGMILGSNKNLSYTTDQGKTWRAPLKGIPPSVNAFTTFYDAAYYNTKTVVMVGRYSYLHTYYNYILGSNNGGSTWTILLEGSGNYVSGVAYAGTTIVVVGGSGLIMYSTNAGSSWTTLDYGSFGFTDVCFPSSTIGYAVGTGGNIWKTTNGGTSWTQQTSGVTESLYGVHFYSTTYGMACGNNGTILKTTNGGTTWIDESYNTTISLRSIYVNQNSAMTVGLGGLILYKSGTRWFNRTAGTTNTLSSLFFVSSTNGHVVGQNGTIRRTTNGGDDWTVQTSGTTSWLYALDFSYSKQYFGIVVGENGTIIKTNDSGANWVSKNSGTTNTLRGADIINYYAYVVGDGGTILFTSDTANTWTAKNSGITTDLYCVDSYILTNCYAVGAGGVILRSTNTGNTWFAQNSGTTANLYAVYTNDDVSAYAAGAGGKILKTTNYGATWVSLNSPTTETIYGIDFPNSSTGIICTMNGNIFRTKDGGATWIAEKSQTGNILYDIQLVNYGSGYLGCACGELGQILNYSYSANLVKYWVGGQSSNWFDANNWSPPGVPAFGDSVVFQAGSTYYPYFNSTYQQATVASMLFTNNGRMNISDSLRRLMVLGDVNVRGSLILNSDATTNIIITGGWQINSVKTKEEKLNLANNGFVYGQSTVTFAGTGAVEDTFYNVSFDATSDMQSIGNITVYNNCVNNSSFELRREDTLIIKNTSTNALTGVGRFTRGTIKRYIGTSTEEEYQFESEDTYIKFNTGSTFPTWVSLTTFPDTLPDDFGRVVVIIPSTVDTVNNIITANGLTEFGLWGIGTDYTDSNGDLVKTRVRRVYSGGTNQGSMKGGVNFNLSIRYDQSEVPVGANESDLKIVRFANNYVAANIKILLQGPHNGSGGLYTYLNTNGYIPTSHPYNTSPWNYSGDEKVITIPSGVVDWVLLELRSSLSTVVSRRAAFLKSDGTIVDLDGTSMVSFADISAGNYYLVVYHRNHLPVMSSATTSLSKSSSLYDFSNAMTKAYGTNPMKDMGSSRYGLYSGDANANGTISAIDRNSYWRVQNGSTGYLSADFSMNGSVSSTDINSHWRTNNGKTSQVPVSSFMKIISDEEELNQTLNDK